jgi:aspartyl-tRNA(Asn)/glutamyl-tRNA(Gln) amidotransferase subunit C
MAGGDKLDVQYVANLARLALTDDEAAAFESQLDEVLRYIGKLQEVDVRDVEPTAHVVAMLNVLRADEARDWFTAEDALRNAPRSANDLFIVTKVIE